MILAIVLFYFAILMVVSWFTTRKSDNEAFFVGNRRSPWALVAFGMIGASISGVTFVSVPGMVLHSDMTYLQTCLGFILGYIVVAFVLLPLYYRLNLTTIYTVLQRAGTGAYKTGAAFFIISKLFGSAAKFYVPCYIIASAIGLPLPATIIFLLSLVWLYTRKGGIRTIVWTDALQTLCMIAALCLIVYNVIDRLDMTTAQAVSAIAADNHSRIFEFEDWTSSRHFLKSFLSGIFIVIVMTGLDQDMMQKNLSCKNLRAAQKDMCTYGLAFVPVNLLFLSLGVLLTMLCQKQGLPLPEKADSLLTMFIDNGTLGSTALILFSIGIVAASFSTVDSSLTALTTCVCVDIANRKEDEKLRHRVHILMALLLTLCVIIFDIVGVTSLIDAVYTLVSYTYGPLLGLFAYVMIRHRNADTPRHPLNGKHVVAVCVLAPLVCYLLSILIPQYTGYHFGYELLMINGILTFVGLCL